MFCSRGLPRIRRWRDGLPGPLCCDGIGISYRSQTNKQYLCRSIALPHLTCLLWTECSSSLDSDLEQVSHFWFEEFEGDKCRFTALLLRLLWQHFERSLNNFQLCICSLLDSDLLGSDSQSSLPVFLVYSGAFGATTVLHFLFPIVVSVLQWKKVDYHVLYLPHHEQRRPFIRIMGGSWVSTPLPMLISVSGDLHPSSPSIIIGSGRPVIWLNGPPLMKPRRDSSVSSILSSF